MPFFPIHHFLFSCYVTTALTVAFPTLCLFHQKGGCVAGATFVPENIWPAEYSFLFIDFIFLKIYNLVRDPGSECRQCSPPTSGYVNKTCKRSVYYVASIKRCDFSYVCVRFYAFYLSFLYHANSFVMIPFMDNFYSLQIGSRRSRKQG